MVSQILVTELGKLPPAITQALAGYHRDNLQNQQCLRLKNEAFRLGLRERNRQLKGLKRENQGLRADIKRLETELGSRDQRLGRGRRVVQCFKVAINRYEDELAEKREIVDQWKRDVSSLKSDNCRLSREIEALHEELAFAKRGADHRKEDLDDWLDMQDEIMKASQKLRIAGTALLGATAKQQQLEDQLRHEVNLRRACVKAELEAKKELDNAIGLWYRQQIRANDLEEAMKRSSNWVKMKQRSEQEATIRRSDAFADLISETQIIWHNINKDSSSAERNQIYELKDKFDEFMAKWDDGESPSVPSKVARSYGRLRYRLSRLEDLIVKRHSLETNAIANMRTEWNYMVARERLYDDLRKAEITLAKMEALDTQKLKEVMRDLRSLDNRTIEKLDPQKTFHFHQTQIPIRSALLEYISHTKRSIDDLEQSRLRTWMDYIRRMNPDENAQNQIRTLRNRRTTRLRVGYKLNGCLYCDDDTCKGCSGTRILETGELGIDSITSSSVEYNERSPTSGRVEDEGKAVSAVEQRMYLGLDNVENHDQLKVTQGRNLPDDLRDLIRLPQEYYKCQESRMDERKYDPVEEIIDERIGQWVRKGGRWTVQLSLVDFTIYAKWTKKCKKTARK